MDSKQKRHSTPRGYATEIITAISNKDIPSIPQILEDFEADMCIRHYANCKTMQLNPTHYVQYTFKEISAFIGEFKNTLKKSSVKSVFNTGDEAIISLIADNLYPTKIIDTYSWLEQIRFFFCDCTYKDMSGTESYVDSAKEFITNNKRFATYMKNINFKNLRFYALPLYNPDRHASCFFYDDAIAVYNWATIKEYPPLLASLVEMGSIYWKVAIEFGDPYTKDSFYKFKKELAKLTPSLNIQEIPDQDLFEDMFALNLLLSDRQYLNAEQIGVRIGVFYENTKETMSLIVDFFSGIVANNTRICRPTSQNPLYKCL